MSIVVKCPHCETKFNLQPDMVGKSMRCPNLDCRQVFLVKPQPKEIEPPLPTPEPIPSPIPQPIPLPPEPARTAKVRTKKVEKPRPASKPIDTPGEIVEAAIVSPPKVKEVVWSEGTDVPPVPKGKKPVRPEVLEEGPDEQPILRRKKKKSRGPLILIGMAIGIVLLGAAAVFYIVRSQDIAEQNLAQQAEEEFKKGDNAAAVRSFDKLVADYPKSDNIDKYKFFAALAGMKGTVFGVTNREDPEAAIRAYRSFIDTQKESPFAKHTSGYGHDIYDAGRKLSEDVVGHAEDRVKKFQGDRTHPDELERADKAVSTGRSLLPMIEPYRAPDDPTLDGTRKELDRVEGMVKRERDRSAALAALTAGLTTQSDAAIQAAENQFFAAGFGNDEEARGMIAAAKGRLRELVKYETDPAAPTSPPASAAATILFVAPIGPIRRPPDRGVGEEIPSSVFLAVARGILYALDEESGTMLWAVRVGTDITDTPTIARVELDGGPTDVALVASNVAGQPAIASYVVRTGAALWHQKLPAPASGPAVVIGPRVYVPLRDPEGTLYEFDLTNGTRRGRIRLGQPLALNAAVVRPGTGLIYAAADARRVYVIDAGAKDDNGNLLDPRCVQVIATGHLPGTIRTPPLLIGAEGEGPAERWMILSQADGLSMLLRAFALMPIQTPSADGKAPPETPATAVAELPINGWGWFPPATDGERLAIVTDFGQFRLFGIHQPGSLDKPLFSMPEPRPPLPTPTDGKVFPGLVFTAEEAAFWVLANGNLQKYRLGLVPARGQELIPVGNSIPLGLPTQFPQFNNRRDSVCLVVQSLNSAGSKAALIDLRDGAIRWQRQLGVVPATNPIPQGESVLIVAEDGGLVAIPSNSQFLPGRNTIAPAEWVIAPPLENATGTTAVALSADEKTVFAVTPVLVRDDQKTIPRFVVRRVENGRVVHEGSVNAPASLAGPPLVLGDSLLLPLADGSVYRHSPGRRPNPDTLTPGPSWVVDRRAADSSCLLSSLSATSFLTNDGGKKLKKWDWPAEGGWASGGAEWELRDRPAGSAVVLPAAQANGTARFLVADVTGSVWMFAVDRGGKHLKRWQPGGGMPVGTLTSPLVLQSNSSAQMLAAYTVERKYLICLDPNRDLPLWAVRVGEDVESTLLGAPQVGEAGQWMVTDLRNEVQNPLGGMRKGAPGAVTLFDAVTGKPAVTMLIELPGAVPATAGRLLGMSQVLTPLSDGSAMVLSLPAQPETGPEPKNEK